MFSMPIFGFWPIFTPSSPISTALWQQMHLMNYLLDLSLKHKWRLFSCRPFARERRRPKTMPWPKLRLPWAHAEHNRKMVQDLFQTEISGSFYHLGNVVKRLQNWRNIFRSTSFSFCAIYSAVRKPPYTCTRSERLISIWMFPLTLLITAPKTFPICQNNNQNSKSYDQLLNVFVCLFTMFSVLFFPPFLVYIYISRASTEVA